MTGSYALPVRLEGAALGTVKAALLEHRGADLTLIGQDVQRLNGLGLQLLMAAFAAWRADGFRLCISEPSEALRDAFRRLNIIHEECEGTVS
ncbi:MAG: hypothetical protein FD125_751 [bacterium]|nr:MAG: hypothetical protein FD125_751 [bacterium]